VTDRDHAPAAPALYRPLDWVLVRAPLLPVEFYLALSSPTPADGSGGARPLLPPEPRVRTALAVGGGDLLEAVDRAGRSVTADRRLAGKVLRYLIRMSTRPTPFGLFAGVALGRWGPVTDLALSDERPPTRTRPDMAWLLPVVFELESRADVRAHLSYHANARAFVRAGRVFLPESAPMSTTSGGPVSVRATAVVRQALALARSPIPHGDLVTKLCSRPGATRPKVEALVEDLRRHTLLLTDLRPPLTTPSPAAYVVSRLRCIPAAEDDLRLLETKLKEMAAWDASPLDDDSASAYVRMAEVVGSDGSEPSRHPPQVDMALPLDGDHLSHAVAAEAARAAELLVRMTPLPVGLTHVDAYRRAFEGRYGHDREVPLLELLDQDFGLGPPSTHVHGGAAIDQRRSALRYQTLRDIALTAFREGQTVVELDEKTLTRLESWSVSPRGAPSSLDLSLFVVARSAADVDAGRFQVVVGPNLGATAAGRNLGRFADLLGKKAGAAIEELGRAEKPHHPDQLRVELVYLPHRSRSANVVTRPHPNCHEIALGTSAGVPPDRVVPLDELVVGVRAGRFYVRWPAAGREIVASAGHMLNNAQAPDVCRFLDDLRLDGIAQLSSFDWGSAADLPFLPRVQAGRVVLAPAQWRVEAGAGEEIADQPGLDRWRTHWRVPRYVYLAFGDNRLLLDLDDEAQAEELRVETRSLPEGGHVVLQEALPAPDQAWLAGPGGSFVTEIVVPLVLRVEAGHDDDDGPRVPSTRPASLEARLRPPGSEWLYAKVYGPRPLEDDLLAGPVADFCHGAAARGDADSWFFVRYSDPEPHLRLRFHGRPDRLVGQLLPALCSFAAELIGEGLCTRLCFDTYDREIERYGGPRAAEAAEAIFGADSAAVVELLRLSRHGLVGIDRTTLAALTIDDLLAGLGLGVTQRLGWYEQRVRSRSASGPEYRRRQGTLRQLLGNDEQLRRQPGGDALIRVLASRREALARAATVLDEVERRGDLGQSRVALYTSYVHLHCNRLLAGDASTEDLTLGLLSRTRHGLERSPLTDPTNGT